MRIVVQILLLTFLASQSSATSVQEGRNGCLLVENSKPGMSDQQLFSLGVCIGVAEGLVTLLVYNCTLGADGLIPRTSPPPSIGAAIRNFINWADDNPERWGEDFADGLIIATMETFPCEPDN